MSFIGNHDSIFVTRRCIAVGTAALSASLAITEPGSFSIGTMTWTGTSVRRSHSRHQHNTGPSPSPMNFWIKLFNIRWYLDDRQMILGLSCKKCPMKAVQCCRTMYSKIRKIWWVASQIECAVVSCNVLLFGVRKCTLKDPKSPEFSKAMQCKGNEGEIAPRSIVYHVDTYRYMSILCPHPSTPRAVANRRWILFAVPSWRLLLTGMAGRIQTELAREKFRSIWFPLNW